MITPGIIGLEKSRGKGKDRRNNILNHSNKPSESEESIAERTKLGRQRSDEIVKKEKMIDTKLFKEYFEYPSSSDMYKNLNKTIDLKKNKAQVNAIKDKLANLIKELKSRLTSNAKKN